MNGLTAVDFLVSSKEDVAREYRSGLGIRVGGRGYRRRIAMWRYEGDNADTFLKVMALKTVSRRPLN